MDTVKIKWIQTNHSESANNKDTAYYAFSRAGNLLYIGIAYSQKVHDEINNTLRRLNINTTGLSIWLGYIESDKTTYNRITEEIVKDAECLMIHTNAPALNIQCKTTYTGRRNLCVKTSGCSLIRKCVKCDSNGKVFLSC